MEMAEKRMSAGVTSRPVPGVVDCGDGSEEDVCSPAGREGLGHGRRDARVGVQVVDERLDVLVRLVALVRLEVVGHEVLAVPHIDGRPAPWVCAAMRARCVRLVVVAGQRKTGSWALMRHSSFDTVDLGSDGMPVKVGSIWSAARDDRRVGPDEGQDYIFLHGSRAVAGVV